MENEAGGAKEEGEEGVVHEGKRERGREGVCEFEKVKKEELEGYQEGACEAGN